MRRPIEEFHAAYEAMLARWPAGVEPIDVPSAYGTTRVNACGPAGASPVVLLHGGGATSTVWFAVASGLAAAHRVYAVDRLGDAGRSVPQGEPFRTAADLMSWLDAVLDGLGLDGTALCGHSYGGWQALRYALHAPARVRRLALLDPTDCFAGLRLHYKLRAVPLVLRGTPRRAEKFLRWETGGRVDHQWLELAALAAAMPTSGLVLPTRPEPAQLRAMTVPTLVLLAEDSRAHDIGQVAATVRAELPRASTAVLAGATHHSIPAHNAGPLTAALVAFLSSDRD